MEKNETIDLMYHDDDCGVLLDDQGKCPACGFHPDMQSVGFRKVDMTSEEVTRRVGGASGFMTTYRTPVVWEGRRPTTDGELRIHLFSSQGGG